MKASLSQSAAASFVALVAAASFALAQPASEATKEGAPKAEAAKPEFVPQVGQSGKDVVWVPTPQSLVDRMLDIAKVTTMDFVMDLGSGDGRTVITAAKRGVRAMGVEYNPNMVELSKRNAEKAGVGDTAQFVQGDIFKTDFSKASVITLFLLPDLNRRLRPLILDMKPGTRVVSNTFDMGEWQADDTISADSANCQSYCRAYFWIVPAKVEGTWTIPQGTLTLEQKFQFVTGTLTSGKNTVKISDGRLRGDQLTFVAGNQRYTSTVTGNTIDGTMSPMFRATKK
ncbi:MAG: class I SAM-dependent methyltransferase [Alphaproteobacteria bacterium]|nr:class I SAM-dependent methyltransferase [Alphaproteobacteria bacterium]